jgi:transposase-like protein
MTLQQIEDKFPDEETARKYLSGLRWGNMASCPHCENKKAYYIEKGRRYKCANPSCHKKFSVTTKTLIEGTNMPLHQWVIGAYIFCNASGEINIWDLEKKIGIMKSSAGFMLDKFKISWKYVFDEEKNVDKKVADLFQGVFFLHDKKEETKRSFYLNDIDNISDRKQFRAVQAYTKTWLMYSHWIQTNQFDVNDIIAETFIWMADNGIKEYTAETVAFYIRKTTQKMWMKWVYAHPNTHEYYLSYWREWGKNARLNLKPTYINKLIKEKNPHMTASEIASNKKMQEEQRLRTAEFRKKNNLLDDFNSHFD